MKHDLDQATGFCRCCLRPWRQIMAEVSAASLGLPREGCTGKPNKPLVPPAVVAPDKPSKPDSIQAGPFAVCEDHRHRWVILPSGTHQRCARCGTERDNPSKACVHKWVNLPQGPEQWCPKCSMKRAECVHEWTVGPNCKICGMPKGRDATHDKRHWIWGVQCESCGKWMLEIEAAKEAWRITPGERPPKDYDCGHPKLPGWKMKKGLEEAVEDCKRIGIYRRAAELEEELEEAKKSKPDETRNYEVKHVCTTTDDPPKASECCHPAWAANSLNGPEYCLFCNAPKPGEGGSKPAPVQERMVGLVRIVDGPTKKDQPMNEAAARAANDERGTGTADPEHKPLLEETMGSRFSWGALAVAAVAVVGLAVGFDRAFPVDAPDALTTVTLHDWDAADGETIVRTPDGQLVKAHGLFDLDDEDKEVVVRQSQLIDHRPYTSDELAELRLREAGEPIRLEEPRRYPVSLRPIKTPERHPDKTDAAALRARMTAVEDRITKVEQERIVNTYRINHLEKQDERVEAIAEEQQRLFARIAELDEELEALAQGQSKQPQEAPQMPF